jgi:hypothetical protein
MWHRVVCWVATDVSEEHSASHLLACWFLLKWFLRPWRWRRYVPPKRRLQLNRLHGITSQMILLIQLHQEDARFWGFLDLRSSANQRWRHMDSWNAVFIHCIKYKPSSQFHIWFVSSQMLNVFSTFWFTHSAESWLWLCLGFPSSLQFILHWV